MQNSLDFQARLTKLYYKTVVHYMQATMLRYLAALDGRVHC